VRAIVSLSKLTPSDADARAALGHRQRRACDVLTAILARQQPMLPAVATIASSAIAGMADDDVDAYRARDRRAFAALVALVEPLPAMASVLVVVFSARGSAFDLSDPVVMSPSPTRAVVLSTPR
jgi:hypothetical protein